MGRSCGIRQLDIFQCPKLGTRGSGRELALFAAMPVAPGWRASRARVLGGAGFPRGQNLRPLTLGWLPGAKPGPQGLRRGTAAIGLGVAYRRRQPHAVSVQVFQGDILLLQDLEEARQGRFRDAELFRQTLKLLSRNTFWTVNRDIPPGVAYSRAAPAGGRLRDRLHDGCVRLDGNDS